MANTYTLINSATAGSGGVASFDFTSIPQTYTDLIITISARSSRTTGGTDGLRLEINGSSANFTYILLDGDGSSAQSAPGSSGLVAQLPQAGGSPGYTANTFASTSIYLPNYAGSNYKSLSIDTTTENNAISSYLDLIALFWSQTAAISSLSLKSTTANNLVQYSTAYLYGISNS